MRGVFFGASVTAQSKGLGYFDYLEEKLLPDDCQLIRRGYGACHFDDAGFFYMPAVLEAQPNFVVFEWNTTGLSKFDPKRLRFAIQELHSKGVYCGFLILPRKDKNIDKDRECELQVKDLCERLNLPLLDLRGKVDAEKCLRDMVHTNELGAKIYASLIVDWVRKNFLGVGGNRKINLGESDIIDEVAHDAIRPLLHLQPNQTRLNSQLIFVGEIKSDVIIDIAMTVNVGPQSPVLEINMLGGHHSKSRVCLFDAWCDYERRMTVSMWPRNSFPKVGSLVVLEIDVSTELPDYSVCRKPDFRYDGERYVDIFSIHTTGIELNFTSCR